MTKDKLFRFPTILAGLVILILGILIWGITKPDDNKLADSIQPGRNTHSHTFHFSPDTSSIWLGTHAGLFKQNGSKWDYFEPLAYMDIMSLEYDPANADVMFIGGHGFIQRSTDGGKSWTNLTSGLPETLDAHIMQMDSNDPNRIFVFMAADRSVIYETRDGGESWRFLMNAPNNTVSLASVKGKPGLLLVGTDRKLTAYDLSSESAQPQDILNEPVYAVAGMPDGDVMAITPSGSKRSTDLKAWSAVPLNLNEEVPVGIRFLDDGLGLVVTQALTVYETRDRGDTWNRRTP
ncbi:hypothetical protein BG53_02855 [Paenibacillus darwinianus]|uniref:Photosynthesis system II assembly factor Ycf48/Hcf136-like domain-containing protein n=1 Tax=Paenibacillus darwinianus TaxID=1380763 RepID=A0A9W5W7G7_9BACL|nr:hypothetical protein [Paenibacillus darwinianus]EXX87951.1 hypothetical protein BG53_02855 [Paenibacillus darwinianus]EXX88365.1 hypothetical protein BG52_02180 [Paenibacillus darwinianus]EXX88402.1 hypothetical protein CH50_03485 [Paenibacillus darwinianus]